MNALSNDATAGLAALRDSAVPATNDAALAGHRSKHRRPLPDAPEAPGSSAFPGGWTSRQAATGLTVSTRTGSGRADARTGHAGHAGERDRRRRFDELVAVHLDDLYRFAYWLSGDRSVADDVVQEALIRAWKSIDRLNDHKAAKGWLLTIVRRENARHFGRKSLQQADTPADGLVAQRTGYDTSTEAFVLRRALDRLPPEYREPLLMQVVYGYSLKEIAEHLGISNAGAGSRLFRAREKMRGLL